MKIYIILLFSLPICVPFHIRIYKNKGSYLHSIQATFNAPSSIHSNHYARHDLNKQTFDMIYLHVSSFPNTPHKHHAILPSSSYVPITHEINQTSYLNPISEMDYGYKKIAQLGYVKGHVLRLHLHLKYHFLLLHSIILPPDPPFLVLYKTYTFHIFKRSAFIKSL